VEEVGTRVEGRQALGVEAKAPKRSFFHQEVDMEDLKIMEQVAQELSKKYEEKK